MSKTMRMLHMHTLGIAKKIFVFIEYLPHGNRGVILRLPWILKLHRPS